MIKSTLITFILFCSTICFSQNSNKENKNSSTTIISGSEEKVKPSFKNEAIGTTPMINLGTPIVETFSPPPPVNNSDQKKSINSKNATKPH